MGLSTYEIESLGESLELCPFCGSKGKLSWHNNNPSQTQVWSASCSSQACSWSNSPYWIPDVEEAVARWNRRTPSPVGAPATSHNNGITAKAQTAIRLMDEMALACRDSEHPQFIYQKCISEWAAS